MIRSNVLKKGEGMLTVTELAMYLRMKPLTIYKHSSTGRLPGFKVGSHWRFKKQTIERWIEEQENNNIHRDGSKNSFNIRPVLSQKEAK